jgi:hypothetical protein
VRAVFSTRFRDDLAAEEAKYAEISDFESAWPDKRGRSLNGRVETISVHTVSHADAPGHFHTTSTTPSRMTQFTSWPLFMSEDILITLKND